MPLPLTMYGVSDCDDTERTRACLRKLGVAFHEVNIDHDPEAERFVIYINGGYRSTPTLVLGEGKFKIVLTEPTEQELEMALIRAGYPIPSTTQISGGPIE